jgi:tetratricopeptide (TPR) repeat protein
MPGGWWVLEICIVKLRKLLFIANMKNPISLITIVVLILGTPSFAQPGPQEELYNILRKEEVYQVINANHLLCPACSQPKAMLEDYIVKHHASPGRLVAMRYLAEVFNKLGYVDSARLLYKQALAIPDSLDERNFYRSFSAIELAKIYMAAKNYDTALNYLDMERDRFPMSSSCGTVRIAHHQEMDVLFWRCYKGCGNYKRAIDRYARLMFLYSGDNLKKLFEAYSSVYTKEEIKQAFLNAENNIVIKTDENDATWLLPVTKIFDKEIKIRVYDEELNNLSVKEQMLKCADAIRQSEIYKLATR